MKYNSNESNKLDAMTFKLLCKVRHTEFYEELKSMTDNIINSEIVELLCKSKYINYNRFSMIPIVFPLCVLYKREQSIMWLKTNIYFNNNIARPILFANMLKYNLDIQHIPEEWKTQKNILKDVCDDYNATLKYLELYPNCFEDQEIGLTNCCVQVLEYYLEHIGGYGIHYILKRFLNLSSASSVGKIGYLGSKFRINYGMIIKLLNAGGQCPSVLEALLSLMKSSIEQKLFCETILVLESEMIFSENQNDNTWLSVLFAGKKLGLTGKQAFEYMGIDIDSEKYDFIKYYDKNIGLKQLFEFEKFQ